LWQHNINKTSNK